MFKKLLLFAFVAVLAQKLLRYYIFMGYLKSSSSAFLNDESYSIECVQKFKQILHLNSTIDADMLPNGLSLFISSNNYSLIESLHRSTLNQSRNAIYMLDMNHINDGATPFTLSIINKVRKNIFLNFSF